MKNLEDNVIHIPKRKPWYKNTLNKEKISQVAEDTSKAFLAVAKTCEVIATLAYVLAKELGMPDRSKKK